MYSVGSRLYNYFKFFFTKVEELGVELEVVASCPVLQDWEILAPIAVELVLNKV